MWDVATSMSNYPDHKEFIALVKDQKQGLVSDEDMMDAINTMDIHQGLKDVWKRHLKSKMTEENFKPCYKEVI